jgi:hypothetical protein
MKRPVQTVAELSAIIDPARAQRAVAAALAVVGASGEWDSQTIDQVVAELRNALPPGLPQPVDQSGAALEFWRVISDGPY